MQSPSCDSSADCGARSAPAVSFARMKHEIELTINERQYRGGVEPRKLLTDFIRDDLGLAGTHAGSRLTHQRPFVWNGLSAC